MSTINLREVLLGRPTRLRYIIRFSICPRNHEESVAEHSFYTAYIAMMLAMDMKESGHSLDLGVVLARALMHDVDESYSGDFIRMFKHSAPSLKLAIDTANLRFVKEFNQAVAPGLALAELWSGAKDASLEGTIVSLADFMSVVSYIIQEIKSGNHNMFEHLEDLKLAFSSFKSERYERLRHYINDCGALIQELSVVQASIK